MPAGMAYVCQGCRGVEEDITEMFPRGIVTEKLYCSKCIERVDEYLDARDALHTRLANEWAEDRAALASNFNDAGIKSLPDGG
jgi:hypothetical protein